MKSNNRLWRWLGLVCVLSFGALGYLGWQIHLQAPPIPKAVVTTDGDVLFTGEQIQLGQQAWRSAGGQQLGTVWGHGSYVAPDWSADWLHREALAYREVRSRALYGEKYEHLAPTQRGAVDAAVRAMANAAQLPPDDQIAQYEATHRILTETLATIDEG